MAYDQTVKPPVQTGELHVVPVELIGHVEDTEIMVDPGALNIGVLPAPIDIQALEIVRPDSVSGEAALPREIGLQS